MYPGLNITVQYTVRQASEDITEPPITRGTQYVTLWSRSIHKPFCIEYTIDENFDPIELLNSLADSEKIFSQAEEKEMMSQLHEMLVKSGIPYHFATLKLSS